MSQPFPTVRSQMTPPLGAEVEPPPVWRVFVESPSFETVVGAPPPLTVPLPDSVVPSSRRATPVRPATARAQLTVCDC